MLQVVILTTVLSSLIPNNHTGMIWVRTDGCQACNRMEGSINKLATEGHPILVVRANTSEFLRREFNGRLLPLTITYRNGKEIERKEGFIDESKLRSMLRTLKQSKKERP